MKRTRRNAWSLLFKSTLPIQPSSSDHGMFEPLESRRLLSGTGLAATYFNNMDLTGTSVQRVDANIKFDWHDAAPAQGIDPGTYSVRWSGQLKAPKSETYTISTLSNDGVRLWVNGQQLIDDWNNHAEQVNSGQITLEAGHKYDIKMEYYQHFGTATAELWWSSPSQPSQVIPTSQLYPDAISDSVPTPPTQAAPKGSGTGLAATYFDNMAVSYTHLTLPTNREV